MLVSVTARGPGKTDEIVSPGKKKKSLRRRGREKGRSVGSLTPRNVSRQPGNTGKKKVEDEPVDTGIWVHQKKELFGGGLRTYQCRFQRPGHERLFD